MHKNFIITAAFFGGLAVALGAFGAHGLEKITTDEKILHGFRTAVQYQMIHALGLLSIAILAEKIKNHWIIWAGRSFILGIILFSGSLYCLTFLEIENNNLVKIIGPITPFGGLCFIAGWVCLLMAVLKQK
ncbi:MAG: DUF423 domain-containing protein [Chitinophagaceae bacterium]|nr:DUF423 domain-containing protein [Chitinophagaceae bacterium]